jgi:hypothetical protein
MNEDPNCYITCPQCDGGIAVLWEQLGQRVVCGRCGELVLAKPPQRGNAEVFYGSPETPRKTWSRGVVFCVGGVLCLLVAAALWYISIQQPMEEMRHHAPLVPYSMKRIVFIPLFAISGAGMTLMGLLSPFIKSLAARSTSSKRALSVVVFVLLMVPGWFLFTWFEEEMKKAGYERGMLGAQPRVIPVPKMNIPQIDSRPDMERIKAQLKQVREEADKAGRQGRN